MTKVLVEDGRQVHSGMGVEILHNVFGHDVPISEVLVEVVNKAPPTAVVIHHAAQRIDEKSTFEILVSRRSAIKAWSSNDRLFVLYFGLVAVQILQCIFGAVHVLHVESFEVGGPAFVNPHIGPVGGGDAIAEPFVPALVDDDEVEFWTDTDTGPVTTQIAVLKAVAVRDCTLMLHPGIWNLYQFISVLCERIFAKIMLVSPQHSFGLGELLFSPVQVLC